LWLCRRGWSTPIRTRMILRQRRSSRYMCFRHFSACDTYALLS
jgi:hypothetical protein